MRMALVGLLVVPALALVACSAPLEAGEVLPPVSETPTPESEPAPGVSAAVHEDTAGVPDGAEGAAKAIEPGIEGETYDTPIRGHAWAEPIIAGDVVTIPVAVAASEDHVHFSVPGSDGDAAFIGWLREGAFDARAIVCPCCGEEAVEWGGTSLVCRGCLEVFDLDTGASSDSCAYPEGTLPAEVSGDVITMSLGGLIEAYDRTAAGEDMLFEPEPEPVEEEDDVPACCRR